MSKTYGFTERRAGELARTFESRRKTSRFRECEKTYEFLKECGTFFLSTICEGRPQTRPFGAVMEYEGELYFCTGNQKEVYRQLLSDPHIQIVACKPDRSWIRVNGRAVEERDLSVKGEMLAACPGLLKRFPDPACPTFALFCVKDREAFLYDDSGRERID